MTLYQERRARVAVLRHLETAEIVARTGIPKDRVERILADLDPHDEIRISEEHAPGKTLPDRPTKGAFQ